MKYFSGHEDYYLKYGLDSDPFPEDAPDDIVYITAELKHRLELIKHLLEFSQQLLLVTAPAEVGKSTLCGYLPTTFESSWVTGTISASEDILPDTFANKVIEEFYPESRNGTGTAISRLHQYLEDCDRQQKLPVMLIDDGHRLSIDTLAFILQLNALTHNETRFRIVIFADDRINATLDDPRIKVATTGIIHTINIPPLTEAQTSAYVEYRLLAAGKINQNPFTHQDTSYLYKVSGGAPGRINRLARQALRDPALVTTGQSLSWRNIIQRLRNPILSALLIFLAFGVFYFIGQRSGDEQPQVISITLPPQATPDRPVFTAPPVTVDAADSQPAADVSDSTPAESSPPPLNEVADEPLQAATPTRTDEVEFTPQPGPEQSALQPQPVVTQQRPAALPTPAITPPEAMSRIFSGIKDGNWVRLQNPDHYVLQLIGARDIKTLEQYLQGAPEIRSQTAFIATWNAGKPWYVFIYGIYPDHDTAVVAVSRLTAVARKGEPWPRTVASVLMDLQKTQ